VVTLADDHATGSGVTLSARTPDRAPDALDQTMPLLASASSGTAPSGSFPWKDAARAHALLESVPSPYRTGKLLPAEENARDR